MKYTDVVKLMKTASEFDDAIEKERKRRLQISKGDPKIEAMFDAGAIQRAAKSQANRIADNNMRAEFDAIQKGKTTVRANNVNAEIARQQKADALAREKAMSGTTTAARPDTLHDSPSTAGKRTGAADAARVKANREFQVRDAQRQDAALRNGTLQTRGSGASGNLSYGQPIQRDANGQNIGRTPSAGAKVVSQYMINGKVYNRMSDGSIQPNQELTEQYATTGVKPQLMKAAPPQAAKRTAQPRQTARPAATTAPAATAPAAGTTPPPAPAAATRKVTPAVQAPPVRTNTTIRTNPQSGTVGSKATVGTKSRPRSVRQ